MTDPPADRIALTRKLVSPLRTIRVQKALSLQDLADHFKVCVATIQRHEKFGRNLGAYLAIGYARFYGTTAEALFGYLLDLYERDPCDSNRPKPRRTTRAAS